MKHARAGLRLLSVILLLGCGSNSDPDQKIERFENEPDLPLREFATHQVLEGLGNTRIETLKRIIANEKLIRGLLESIIWGNASAEVVLPQLKHAVNRRNALGKKQYADTPPEEDIKPYLFAARYYTFSAGFALGMACNKAPDHRAAIRSVLDDYDAVTNGELEPLIIEKGQTSIPMNGLGDTPEETTMRHNVNERQIRDMLESIIEGETSPEATLSKLEPIIDRRIALRKRLASYNLTQNQEVKRITSYPTYYIVGSLGIATGWIGEEYPTLDALLHR